MSIFLKEMFRPKVKKENNGCTLQGLQQTTNVEIKTEPEWNDGKESMEVDCKDGSVGLEQRKVCFMLVKKFSKEVSTYKT